MLTHRLGQRRRARGFPGAGDEIRAGSQPADQETEQSPPGEVQGYLRGPERAEGQAALHLLHPRPRQEGGQGHLLQDGLPQVHDGARPQVHPQRHQEHRSPDFP